jgi:hypothetical protein
MTNYLTEHDLNTAAALDVRLHDKEETICVRKAQIREIRQRVRQIEKIETTAERCFVLKPIHDQYIQIHWKLKKEHFYKIHKAELNEWKSCDRFLRANISGRTYYPQAFQEEKEKLRRIHEEGQEKLRRIHEEGQEKLRGKAEDLLRGFRGRAVSTLEETKLAADTAKLIFEDINEDLWGDLEDLFKS